VPSVFHRELEKNYGLVPQSPTESPTESPTAITDGIVPLVFHRELEKNYGLVPQLPTESPTALTDRNHRRNGDRNHMSQSARLSEARYY